MQATTLTDGKHHVIELPAVRSLLRHAGLHLLEGMVIGLVLFYVLKTTVGLDWALIGGLIWSYSALGRRVLRRERIPGILLLGTLLMTARSLIALAMHSTFIYFLQPTLGTFLVAGLFLASVPLGRPLAQRLAHDFCPLPESLLANDAVRRFFLRISLLWAAVYIINGSTSLWMLLHASLGTFMIGKSVASTSVVVGAIALSYLWFRRSLQSEGVTLRWARYRPASVPAA